MVLKKIKASSLLRIADYLKLWLPAILWAVVIFLFSSYPTAQASEIEWRDFVVKKTYHLIEYAILATLLYRAFKESGIEKRKAGIYSIIFAALYGASDELHQSFTPGRDARLRDVIIDTIGASVAIYIIWKQLPKAPKKLKRWAAKLQLT